ncbi:MAG: JAB domain-containing protein [Cyclobacteriaceae bacterium]|nr:JAB domain-containing protein [Cyclobacteriaceae bacterium]
MENSLSIDFQVAEIKLSYSTNVKPSLRPKVNCSRDSYELLMANWDKSKLEFQEQFKVMYLNRANKVLGILEPFTGGVSGTVADPKIIFAGALKACASAMIVCHNHPSGNLTASQADIDLTRKLKEGGKLLEIQLLDHIILTTEKYFSFADEGLI